MKSTTPRQKIRSRTHGCYLNIPNPNGHAHQQPVVLEVQEAQDPDEPLLQRPSSFGIKFDDPLHDIELQYVGLGSKNFHIQDVPTDGGLVWDGDPGTAHVFEW